MWWCLLAYIIDFTISYCYYCEVHTEALLRSIQSLSALLDHSESYVMTDECARIVYLY